MDVFSKLVVSSAVLHKKLIFNLFSHRTLVHRSLIENLFFFPTKMKFLKRLEGSDWVKKKLSDHVTSLCGFLLSADQ